MIFRLIASLAVVVGLLLLLARLVGRRLSGRDGSLVRVLHRQPLTRAASVSVVTVGSRVLVLGTTDQQVRVLAELDPEDVEGDLTTLEAVADLDETEDPAALEGAGGGRVVRPAPLTLTRAATRGRSTGRRAGAHRAAPTAPVGSQGALAGSVLSPQTWKQALAAATGKAS